MLKDIFIKEGRKRDNLSQATARALALGNDITAYGHSVTFVEDTMRSTQDLMASRTRMPAIYPAQALLDRIQNNQTPKQRIKDYLADYSLRTAFWHCYRTLRQLGQSRRQILTTVYETINSNS
jgi:hypothetical protein